MNRGQFIKGVTSALAFAKVLDLAADSEDGSALAAQKKWFQEAQYGMMVHWGLYSLLGGEWKGRAMRKPYHIAEWVQQYFRIPNAEYAKLAKAFNPILFDPKDWMKRARDAVHHAPKVRHEPPISRVTVL